MADDLKSFAKKIRKVGQNVQTNATAAVRKLAVRINQVVITETPVNSGRARNNWFATVGLPSEETTDLKRYDKTGQTRINKNNAEISTVGEDQSVYISNNLAYIKKLNEGSSAQAPAGFVEAAVTLAQESMKKIKLLKEPE